MTDDPRALAEETLAFYSANWEPEDQREIDLARALLDALDRAEAAERLNGIELDVAKQEHERRVAAERERDEARDATNENRDWYAIAYHRLQKAEAALRDSAEALHGLSEDPEHLRNTFDECPNYHCAKARAALSPARSSTADDIAAAERDLAAGETSTWEEMFPEGKQ